MTRQKTILTLCCCSLAELHCRAIDRERAGGLDFGGTRHRAVRGVLELKFWLRLSERPYRYFDDAHQCPRSVKAAGG